LDMSGRRREKGGGRRGGTYFEVFETAAVAAWYAAMGRGGQRSISAFSAGGPGAMVARR
jgi:hypothetical protein